ncbi:MAG: hypothetical protein AB7L90_06610 [Hyphomicrobiaceae bacterium]
MAGKGVDDARVRAASLGRGVDLDWDDSTAHPAAAARRTVPTVSTAMPPSTARTMTVTAARESVTYMLAASEARLPDALRARAGLAHVQPKNAPMEVADTDGARRTSMRPLPTSGELHWAGRHDREQRQVVRGSEPSARPADARGSLRAIARRIGPQTGEG